MGPNGSGKSTLANTLLGHPTYEVTEGSIRLQGRGADRGRAARAREGGAVPGLPVPRGDPGGVGGELPAHGDQRQARGADQRQRVPRRSCSTRSSCSTWTARSPRATSTTASPAARRSARRSCRWRCSNRTWRSSTRPTRASTSTRCARSRRASRGCTSEQGLGALIITHYQRILHYIKPQFVHIMLDGRIVLEGGVELVERLEREGYDEIRQEFGEPNGNGNGHV